MTSDKSYCLDTCFLGHLQTFIPQFVVDYVDLKNIPLNIFL